MVDALTISSTGMNAQQTMIDIIANNLANINTTSFKKTRVNFQDLIYAAVQQGPDATQTLPILGLGTSIGQTQKMFAQGDLKATDRILDLAISGDGFFEIQLPNGNKAYTRSGSFQVNDQGYLTNNDGYLVGNGIQIPSDVEDLVFEETGLVKARLAGDKDLSVLGEISLTRFSNNSGLLPIGDNQYQATRASGDAMVYQPSQNNTGLVAQGYLETSNVALVEEMTNLMMAQRAYQINSKVAQVSDEIMSLINQIKR
ncbi:MAG: flagellar basal-body rod protein FlgG [Gammaproteobacteria bacterium]|nr:flagellar basal-body rod protein FlgG [Gammaproteobacteria bacterium]MDH5728915.1 flagellar basal-body rod protein FlgG [Gammaproteobacteria bacterium]